MTYLLTGLGLFLAGSGYKLLPTNQVELELTIALQKLFKPAYLRGFFREIWYCGRTSFTIINLVIFTSLRWGAGLISLAVFGAAAGLEMLVKRLFHRQRPFKEAPEVAMLQPVEPQDSSFPSGDAFRIWFLALTFAAYAGQHPGIWTAMIALAALVSVGRLVLGVHYLSDVLAGIGLGWLAAGTTIWLWGVFHLL